MLGARMIAPVMKIGLYEEPGVKSADGEPVVTRVLTIMLAEEY